MEKILVLNSGSSSLKYQLFNVDGDKFEVVAKGLADRIGIEGSLVTIKVGDGDKVTTELPLPTHKEAIKEVLDLLLGINDAERLPPMLSERREHRRELKRTLSHICGLPYDTGKEPSRMNLLMTREVAGKLSRDLILDEDIEALIRYCEQTQQFLLDEQTGRRIGHLRRGYITYWAEYALENGSWRLYNAYSHRMQLKNDCAVSPEDTPCES